MEKYSSWRDASTGIQPFIPPSAGNVSPLISAVLAPLCVVNVALRLALLAIIGLVYALLSGVFIVLKPIPGLHRIAEGWVIWLTGRFALAIMGYWYIDSDTVTSKRGNRAIAQSADTLPRQGDLIISNWTSYIDIIYLATRYNPSFVLPIFSSSTSPSFPDAPTAIPADTLKYGRSTGTGSANIAQKTRSEPWPRAIGYKKYSLMEMIGRTGQAPETFGVIPVGAYKTLKEARIKEGRPVVCLPEGTTSNGRSILRFGEGVLEADDVGEVQKGQVWIKYLRHGAPTMLAPSAVCPLPAATNHLLKSLLYTPNPFLSRSLSERTLHPSSSPSSPSFLTGEILRDTPGGLEAAGRDGKGAWREACRIVLSETGRTRRVQMGWVEKQSFVEAWNARR